MEILLTKYLNDVNIKANSNNLNYHKILGAVINHGKGFD